MSKPAPISQKKRRLEDAMKGKTQRPRKKAKKQQEYHSSSEDEDLSDNGFTAVNLADSEDEDSQTLPAGKFRGQSKALPTATTANVPVGEAAQSKDDDDNDKDDVSEASEASGADGEGDEDDSDVDEEEDLAIQSGNGILKRKVSKRNDPEAFSTAISKILSTKLSQSARKDPVLLRSKEAVETSQEIANEKLEHRARAKIRAEKKEELERGRIKDVLGTSTGETGRVAEEEKRLRKIAQRGVVKLFNAVRAAQVRGEQAAREERKKGTIGMANREEKVNEMSKQGFLELISGKPKTIPKTSAPAEVEEE